MFSCGTAQLERPPGARPKTDARCWWFRKIAPCVFWGSRQRSARQVEPTPSLSPPCGGTRRRALGLQEGAEPQQWRVMGTGWKREAGTLTPLGPFFYFRISSAKRRAGGPASPKNAELLADKMQVGPPAVHAMAGAGQVVPHTGRHNVVCVLCARVCVCVCLFVSSVLCHCLGAPLPLAEARRDQRGHQMPKVTAAGMPMA